MYEELNSEAYAKAGTEYLFVTVLSALCALANPDLILANKRIDTSLKTPSLTSQGSRATTVLLLMHLLVTHRTACPAASSSLSLCSTYQLCHVI